MTTYFAVVKFEAEDDFNEDSFLNRIADAVVELGGSEDDEVIGTLSGPANGSLDDAFDAGRGYLQAVKR